MAFQPYSLWIDLSANRLTAGPGSEATQPRLQFIQGDNAEINIHLLKRVDGILVETDFPAGSTLKVGVGKREALPTGGSFNLSYASEDTADIPYNAAAGDIADALNALTTVTSDGGVDVTAVGDAFVIKWLTGTSHTDITGVSDGLYPKSIVRLANLQSPTEQTVFLHLAQSMVAYNESWSPIAASVATLVETVPYDDNGIAMVYRLEVTGEPISGYVNILYTQKVGNNFNNIGTITVGIDATATELYTALKQVGATTTAVIDVVKVDSYTWDITIDNDDWLQVTADSITSSKGRTGSLSFNTTEVHTFLAGSESGLSTIEVLLLTAAGEQTVLQSDCIIFSDIIDSSALSPLNLDTPLGENTANQRFVRRDTTQSPTSLELNNIWLNLGVSRIGTDVADAISNSSSPTAGNPFATTGDLIGKYDTSNPAGFITASDLTGLASETWVQSQGYLTTPFDPTGYATESWVQSQGYLTTPFDPTGYATESWVQSQGYLTSAPPPSVSDLTGDVSWNAYAGTGRLIVDGVVVVGETFTSSRMTFGGTSPNSIGNGDFWFNGTYFCYGLGGTQIIASQDWVGSQITTLQYNIGSYYQPISGMSAYAQKSGTTFTGKVITASTALSAGFNLGSGTAPSTPIAGDIWTASNTDTLRYRAPLTNQTFDVAVRNATNTFNSPNIIDTTSNTAAALRITQKGTFPAFVVEDAINPDSSAFVVDQNGSVGVGVDATSFSPTNKLEVVGSVKATSITFDGTAQFKVNSVQSHTGGADTHELRISFNGSTYKMGVVFVSTP